MPWQQVEILSSDVAALSARNLIQQFANAYRSAGLPADALVYHCSSAAGDHLFYFSPGAVLVAEAVLRSFGATACSQPPSLTGCKPVTM